MKLGLPALSLLLAAASPQTDEALVRQVRGAVLHHHLTPKPDCLEFRVTRNATPSADAVSVGGRHDTKCGGDPNLDEVLFYVFVNRQTGEMKTNAGDVGGDTLKVLLP